MSTGMPSIPRNMVLALLALLAVPLAATAQRPVQSVIGAVYMVGDSGSPVAGAEVLVGQRRAQTDASGRFRVDSLAPGLYPLTVRLVGYRPIRSRVTVVDWEPARVEYFLTPWPVSLPDIVVEGRREGIYGVVRTREFAPVTGATIKLSGGGGGSGEERSDSGGHFAFPLARSGVYLVRVSHPNYLGRQLALLLKKGEGRELSIELPSGYSQPDRIRETALRDLDVRLRFSLSRNLLVEADLRRYGSLEVCNVPRVRAHLREWRGAVPYLEGEARLIPEELCTWHMDEVSLIELVPGEVRRTLQGPVKTGGRVILWPR